MLSLNGLLDDVLGHQSGRGVFVISFLSRRRPRSSAKTFSTWKARGMTWFCPFGKYRRTTCDCSTTRTRTLNTDVKVEAVSRVADAVALSSDHGGSGVSEWKGPYRSSLLEEEEGVDGACVSGGGDEGVGGIRELSKVSCCCLGFAGTSKLFLVGVFREAVFAID
jgi:hypothetical protein